MSISVKPLLRRVLEIIFGGLFVYAGYLKGWHPEEFATAILAYRLVPETLVGGVAAVLPWLELIPGAFLVLGIKPRSSLLLLMFLLAGFLVVLLVTLARGLRIDCGCGLFSRQVGPPALAEDAILLAVAVGLYRWQLQRRFPRQHSER
jgi:hypothetical protein